jgi:C4-dicarboxylate-specific signal transduction histidine kinase
MALFSLSTAPNRGVFSMKNRITRGKTRNPFEASRAEVAKASRASTASALTVFLSHELNQPLAALVTNAQAMNRWIDRDVIDVAALRRITDRLVSSSLRASEIVRNVRGLASKRRRETDVFSVQELVREVVGILEADLTDKAITTTLNGGEEAVSIQGVRIELEQVLVNLVSNSIDALETTSHRDRRIEITTLSAGGRLRLVVRDTGPGIGDLDLEQLATPFYTSKEDGMGLGLFVSRSFVQAGGGTLKASNHPDGGARFEIDLPLEECNE